MADTSGSPENGAQPGGANPQNTGTPQGEQAKKDTPDTVSVEDYKNLQGFATKDRQELIRTKVELARLNPKSIADISDVKLQNKVIEEIFPSFKTLEEVKLVKGERFWESNDEDLDDTEKIKREMTMLRHQMQTREIETAIREYKASHPKVMDTPEKEAELRENLSLISGNLPPEERVKKAAKLAFAEVVADDTVRAYLQLQNMNV